MCMMRGVITWIREAILGIRDTPNTIEKIVEELNSISLVSSLLVGVAASGLYESFACIHELGQESPDSYEYKIGVWTTFGFCVDTFMFLTSTITSVSYTSIAHNSIDVNHFKRTLGRACYIPSLYLRLGFITMIGAFASLFTVVMDLVSMGGCLGFCIVTTVAPMFWGISKTISSPPDVNDLARK